MEVNKMISIINSKAYDLPFMIDDKEYKFVNKDGFLYESGEYEYRASIPGIYFKYSDKWILYSETIGGLINLADKMSDDDHITLSANLSLNKIKRNDRPEICKT